VLSNKATTSRRGQDGLEIVRTKRDLRTFARPVGGVIVTDHFSGFVTVRFAPPIY